jgi:hypothetical protein
MEAPHHQNKFGGTQATVLKYAEGRGEPGPSRRTLPNPSMEDIVLDRMCVDDQRSEIGGEADDNSAGGVPPRRVGPDAFSPNAE